MKTILGAYIVANYPMEHVPVLLARLDGPDAGIGGGFAAFMVGHIAEWKARESRLETWRAEADLARFSE